MYHEIIENQIDLMYNDIFPFRGIVEELEQESINENIGGFSSREIIVRLLYMPKDEKENIVEIKNNNFITYNSKKYIIDTNSKGKGIDGFYYNIHAFEMIKEDNPIIPNHIRDKLILFINSLLPDVPKIKLIEKFKLKTQERFDSLEYPRYFFDFRKISNTDISKVTKKDGMEETRYDNTWLLELEVYSGINDVFEVSEIFQDEEEIALQGLKFISKNKEFKNVTLNSFETIANQNLFQNNQPRIRKLYSIEFSVSYVKDTKFIVGIEDVEVKGGIINAENNRF